MDEEAKKKAQLAMMKLDDIMGMDEKTNEAEDGRSMMEVMRAKREATEKLVEEQKANCSNLPESIEERQKRLKAQRDLLRKMKDSEREKELAEFNEKTKTKGTLYDELKKIDADKKTTTDLAELEKRRMIMKNVRGQIDVDEAAEKQK